MGKNLSPSEDKELILAAVDDLIWDFLYYHRVDNKLPIGAIEETWHSGVITVEEMTKRFTLQLIDGLYFMNDPEECGE